MLVLAMDTATDVVSVGLVSVSGGVATGDAAEPATVETATAVLATRERPGARRHGEQLMPAVLELCADIGRSLRSVDAVVCGAGPGPFTGLRVGLVTAAGLGDALDVPVYGVCSLDAIAASGAEVVGEPLLVVSDARRREVYWSAYQANGERVAGPSVHTPAELADMVGRLGVRRVAGPVAAQYAELFGLPEYPYAGAALTPSPAGLVASAGDELRLRRPPAPLRPHYLRRPDAVPPTARKRVSPDRPSMSSA
jgi:tRNA threonylcarbamoyl adenosine modification protein YeaZ